MLHYDLQNVSSSTLLILRRTNCITTASGIVTLCKQRYSMQVENGLSACCSKHVEDRSVTYIIIIGIQPLGRSGQRPEFSQETGMVLVRCILGKFLGVAFHCFPPLFGCSQFSPPGPSTSATTWEIPAAEVGIVGENYKNIGECTFYKCIPCLTSQVVQVNVYICIM